MGADTDPSAFTTRIEPPFSVTRKVLSGRNASDHGALRRSVTICVWNGADGGGAGASVCPGNAGLGSGDCAPSVPSAAVIKTSIGKLIAAFVEFTQYLAIRGSCPVGLCTTNRSEGPDTQSALANRQFVTSFCTILSNPWCRKVIDKADCTRMFQIGDRRMLVAYFRTEFVRRDCCAKQQRRGAGVVRSNSE